MNSGKRFSVDPGWKAMLSAIGLAEAEVLRHAQLPGDLFATKEPSLPSEDYFRLWESMEAMSDDPCFALELVNGLSPDVFDPVLFAAFCSPDLNTALDRIQHFKPLIGPLRLDISRSSASTTVIIDFSATGLEVPGSLVAAELAFFVQFSRLATRVHIEPMAVLSPVTLPSSNRYNDYFGVKPKKSKQAGIQFSNDDAKRPFVSENARMWDFFIPGLKERLSELTTDARTEDRVRSALLEMLPSGQSSISDTAKRLAVSTRTLQRRLGAEGTNYQTVLDRVREKLALHYLKNSTLSGAQISYLLGYQDPNSFFRAFHAWCGTTPESVRMETIQ